MQERKRVTGKWLKPEKWNSTTVPLRQPRPEAQLLHVLLKSVLRSLSLGWHSIDTAAACAVFLPAYAPHRKRLSLCFHLSLWHLPWLEDMTKQKMAFDIKPNFSSSWNTANPLKATRTFKWFPFKTHRPSRCLPTKTLFQRPTNQARYRLTPPL